MYLYITVSSLIFLWTCTPVYHGIDQSALQHQNLLCKLQFYIVTLYRDIRYEGLNVLAFEVVSLPQKYPYH